jgi:hypothetical protein
MIRLPRRAADERRAQGLGILAETMPLRALSPAELLTHGHAEVPRAYRAGLLSSPPINGGRYGAGSDHRKADYQKINNSIHSPQDFHVIESCLIITAVLLFHTFPLFSCL